MAFQNFYDNCSLSAAKDILAFLPVTVDCGEVKVTVMESDLEAYPGMFIEVDKEKMGLKGVFAPYPKATDHYPWRMQEYVTETEDFIAKTSGERNYPWRVLAVSRNDAELPVNNMVYALASPSRVADTSWIKGGKVAWDWWNDWGLSGVDFKAGINMPTYKHYIDFAAKYGLEYIILDEGWYNPKSGNMLNTIPEINLPELVEYGKSKNVGIVLWTVFNVLDKDLKAACKKYSEMGIKGFKVDFLDRNDQAAVEMVYRICEECSKHKLILDLHGIYAPTGINRTYPNVLNFEGVFGMEEAKWTYADKTDMPLYDVTFPFIRMQAGYVDFTPGGFRNASKKDFQPIYYNPLTMGTRCHQLAMYIIHDSPFTMLADNPIIYEQESECTQFIASLPTVYDEMKIVDGKIGEYIIVARRLGDDWYIAGQTNWNQRKADFTLDFIENPNEYEVEYIIDGLNADKDARDYVIKREGQIKTNWSIHMASGGGFAMKIIKKH
jgi:alpha-glucosidase